MEIPLSNVLLLCLLFLLIGGVIIILLQYLLFVKFSDLPNESEEQKMMNAKYSLPLNIKQIARALRLSQTGGNCSDVPENNVQGTTTLMALNFIMQFLFHEFKNSNRVRKWFYRKISIELDELITKTTTGKLLDKLTIKELELGDQFPDIKMLTIHNVQLDESEQRIENLDLLLDINYIGNFFTSIDADMVLGKKGSIMLKVQQLSGMARLQFTRNPYTHWSLSFLGDPELNLVIESKYQGRQMQSNITNLISNQIRKAVRRKHTLPNYKVRYKPFFHWTADDEPADCDIQPNGRLSVRIFELTRLMAWSDIKNVYCTITLAPVSFIEAHQNDEQHVLISLDIMIHKAKNQQIGIVFKQNSSQVVKIESILPNTPACKSNLLSGDALIAIDGKPVTTIQQIAKIVKNLQSTGCCLRIERIIPGIIRQDAMLPDLLNNDEFHTLKSEHNDVKMAFKHLPDKGRRNSNESEFDSLPTGSPKKSKIIAETIKKTVTRESAANQRKDKDKHKLGDNLLKMTCSTDDKSSMLTDKINIDVNYFYQHSTIDCNLTPFIHMDDLSNFKLDKNCRFLNVGVFGKYLDENILLGYQNIQISQILVECSETSLNQCLKQVVLSPSTTMEIKPQLLANQSGFNENLLFGDILLGFSWKGNPNKINSDSISKPQSPVRKLFSTTNKIHEESSAAANTTIFKCHTFVRTHFNRATQCDFCGKKIWLKDAMQCKECSMCCHKKCIAKCQNATVCGTVHCFGSQQTENSAHTRSNNKPEFTFTQEECKKTEEQNCLIQAKDTPKQDDAALQQYESIDGDRASLSEMLAQEIRRQADTLDIPGIMSSLSGNNLLNSKSLPPSPQHTPLRKVSISDEALSQNFLNPFVKITQHLEALPLNCSELSIEQIILITEPIVRHSQGEDLMNLAKSYSKELYVKVSPNERVTKINILLTKLKAALDTEAKSYTLQNYTETMLESETPWTSSQEIKSEERVQALSIIMLYLCTGLQHAQAIVRQ